MEPVLTTIVSALVAGATAKAGDVASQAVMDTYNGLKGLIAKKLGKVGAVQSVEDDPESETAQAALMEAVAKQKLHNDTELHALAQSLESAIQAAASPGLADIEVQAVHGRVNAIVERLAAAGRIKIGPVTADTGDARVSDLVAGATHSDQSLKKK